MKRSHKRLVAFALATTMVFGSTITALADDAASGTEKTAASATGNLQAVNKEVYKVEIPTQERMNEILSFYVDPQGLIKETKGGLATTDSSVTIGDSKILFANKGDTDVTSASVVKALSDKSDLLTITNKSAIGVNIKYSFGLDNTSVTYAGDYATSADFSGDDISKGLYFGIQADNEVEKAVKSASAVTVTNSVISAVDQYETTVTGSAYHFTLKDDAKDFPTYSFRVVGALNESVPMSTWMTRSGDTDTAFTAKTFKKLQIKFTPTAIHDVNNVAAAYANGFLCVYKPYAADLSTDGGFGDEAKATKLMINGKSADLTKVENFVGYIGYPEDEIRKLWDLPEDTEVDYKSFVKNVVLQTDKEDATFYAEIK